MVSLVLVGSLPTALAQRATVRISEEVVPAGHLVDNYGRSLYLNRADEDGESTCYDECAANWPPLLVRGNPVAGEGVDESLLGTIERENGSIQLTYDGWPLYYYSADTSAGEYLGQGIGDQWYLVSAEGEPLADVEPPESRAEDEAEDGEPAEEDEAEGEEEALAEGVDAEVYEQGRANYANVCAACHGQNGQGGQGPPLAGNERLADAQHVADVIVNGFGYMPAVGSDRSDEWVAAAATYVRNSWGNDFGPVNPEEVEAVR